MSAIDATNYVVELASIEAARERIAGRVARTPMLASSTAARWTEAAVRERSGQEIRLAGGRLYLKADHLQTTGSF
jgi:threonine dehydratase